MCSGLSLQIDVRPPLCIWLAEISQKARLCNWFSVYFVRPNVDRLVGTRCLLLVEVSPIMMSLSLEMSRKSFWGTSVSFQTISSSGTQLCTSRHLYLPDHQWDEWGYETSLLVSSKTSKDHRQALSVSLIHLTLLEARQLWLHPHRFVITSVDDFHSLTFLDALVTPGIQGSPWCLVP